MGTVQGVTPCEMRTTLENLSVLTEDLSDSMWVRALGDVGKALRCSLMAKA